MRTRLLALVLPPLIGACVVNPLTPSVSGSGSGGTSFRVPALQPPPPTLTAISPSSAAPGQFVTLVLTGTNFRQNDAYPSIDGKGVSILAFSVKSATEITTDVTVEAKALPGEHRVKVTTSGGTTEPVTFAVVVSPQSAVVSR